MVAGKLEARGRRFGNIKFTLQENLNLAVNESSDIPSPAHVRLIAGRTNTEGRLQVCNLFNCSDYVNLSFNLV